MKLKELLTITFNTLFKWSKSRLVKAIIALREQYLELEAQYKHLQEENTRLKEQLEQDKIKATNKEVNKPSSKQAEWEKNGSEKGKGKRGKRKARKGAGNRPKRKNPNQTATASVEKCDLCGKHLSDQPCLESSNERIIEDIPEPVEETVVTLVKQEKNTATTVNKLSRPNLIWLYLALILV